MGKVALGFAVIVGVYYGAKWLKEHSHHEPAPAPPHPPPEPVHLEGDAGAPHG
jgi:hypothetical protein